MARGDINFGLVESRSEIRDFGNFIDRFHGDYDPKHHQDWNRGKNVPALKSGERTGFGFWLGRELRGGLELMPDSDVPLWVNLKYFRNAAPDFSGRGAAGFMMKQVGPLGQMVLEQQTVVPSGASQFTVELDTRAGSPAQSFFEHFGFRVVDAAPLYDENVLDVIMQREYELA